MGNILHTIRKKVKRDYTHVRAAAFMLHAVFAVPCGVLLHLPAVCDTANAAVLKTFFLTAIFPFKK